MARKTFALTKYEQYLVTSHEYRMSTENLLMIGYIGNVVCQRLSIDPNKFIVTWDSSKGELYVDDMPVKKGEDGSVAAQPTNGVGEETDIKKEVPKTDGQPI